jgi:predicted chitinase
MQLFQGVVENRQDPLKLGRCQVRIVGLHTHDKVKLRTEDLPWAYPMQPITSAAMSGIGNAPVGPVEGTWVVLMFRDGDSDQQYPVMMGSIGGIPQTPGAIDADPIGIVFKDDTTGETPSQPSEVVSSDSGEAVSTAEPPKDSTPTTITTDIPTTPPKGTPNVAAATAGIKAILAACEKHGLTTREQKCSLLAIAGGESLWVPKEEGYSYSAAALQSTFKTTFSGKPDLAEKYARWKGTRESFFDFVYAPENNGKQLGNTQAGDGGKYYGRGFNGVTGRANYQKFGQLAGVDIINNPLLLTNDLSVAASVFCLMVINNPVVKKAIPTDNPGYFYAVKKGNGNDTGNGAATRLAYYEYFYGNKVPSSFTEDKSAAPQSAPPTEQQSSSGSAAPSSENGPIGFKDPNNKYPLKSFINEPDTNRLARGVKKGTNVNVKEENRVIGVSKALGQGTFDEPPSTYAAKYPFNHVMETESGHVQEWDDTPGNERISTYHRKGTFTEVDANGTEVTHIVGDRYTIIDRNGCIYIAGEANLTVDGNINILCKSDANIEVTGDATMQVGGDYKLGVAGNMEVAVGGTYSLYSVGNLSSQTAGEMNIRAASHLLSKAGGAMHSQAGSAYALDAPVVNMNSGASASASSVVLTPPAAGAPLNPSISYTIPPETAGEDTFRFETEDDWNTPEGKAKREELNKKYGEQTPENTPAEDSATKQTGGTDKNTIASCKVIYSTEQFTNDFRLSKSFTLGMMIDGGVNGQNKLKDQCGLTKQQIVCNLAQLCENILEPLISAGLLPGGAAGYGKQWTINSGYRSTGNSANASTSDHPYGRATDISLLPKDGTRKQRHYEFAQAIEKILPYDQIILEYDQPSSCWVHVGYRGAKQGDTVGQGGANRKMAFTMLNGSVYKRENGQPKGFYLL